jgi:hypothetical protein
MGARFLSALLSQVLVAFTVEFDNEFERRMSEAGDPGGASVTSGVGESDAIRGSKYLCACPGGTTPAGALPHFPAWDMNRGFGP